MLVIGKTIISEEILEKRFVCQLSSCKGSCCILGDEGAPLERGELRLLKANYPVFQKYMTSQGIESVEKQGLYTKNSHGDYATPLIDGKECAFTCFENGIAFCAIEKAFNEGSIKFRKPISCHLYPIRITKMGQYDALNYHEWDICKSALQNGKILNVPMFVFLKEPLIRRFGKTWFAELELAEQYLASKNNIT